MALCNRKSYYTVAETLYLVGGVKIDILLEFRLNNACSFNLKLDYVKYPTVSESLKFFYCQVHIVF